MTRFLVALVCGLTLLAPAACKIVKTKPADSQAADPDATLIAGIVADTYQSKLLPLIAQKATDAAVLVPQVTSDLEAAGAAHGAKGAGEGGMWTFAITGQGVVVSEDRKSRAGKLVLDVTGDGQGDLTLQLGPVVKGTALRDLAPFYDFTAFRDQIQFAQLGRALNDHAAAALKVPEGDLTGRTVSFAGAFAIHGAKDVILVTPTTLTVAP